MSHSIWRSAIGWIPCVFAFGIWFDNLLIVFWILGLYKRFSKRFSLIKNVSKSSKGVLWTILGLVGSMMLVGGSNFYMSYMLDLLEYSRFSFIHMMAVYTGAVVQLSISSSAPRVIAKSKKNDSLIVDKLAAASFYSLCFFTVIALLTEEVLTGYYKVTHWEYIFYISITLLFSVSLNINGILYGINQIKKSSVQLVIVSVIYLAILSQGIKGGIVEYELISKSVFVLTAMVIVFGVAKHNLKYCSMSEVHRFVRSVDGVSYLLPSVVAGIVNGASLVLIYSAFGKAANGSVLLGYAGYLMLLRSAVLFLSTALNRFYFLKFSNEYFENQGSLMEGRILNLLAKNVVSVLISGVVIIFMYYFFYDNYFLKYEDMPNVVYVLFGLWMVVETVYLALYQKIQVYGLMWDSLLIIALPTAIYAFLVSKFKLIYNLESLLLVYISIMIFSILATLHLARKHEK